MSQQEAGIEGGRVRSYQIICGALEQCQCDVIFLVSGPGAVLENMRKIVCIELRSVAEQLEAGGLLAVEDSHPEHDWVILELALAGEAAALVVGGAGGLALVLQGHRLVLQVGPHHALRPLLPPRLQASHQ